MCASESSSDDDTTQSSADYFNLNDTDWDERLQESADREYDKLRSNLMLSESATTLGTRKHGAARKPSPQPFVKRFRSQYKTADPVNPVIKYPESVASSASSPPHRPPIETTKSEQKTVRFDPALAFSEHVVSEKYVSRTAYRPFFKITGHSKPITASFWAPAPFGELLLSSSLDGCVKLWLTTTGRCLYIRQAEQSIRCARFTLCGRKVFRCGWDGQLVLLDPSVDGAVFACTPDGGPPSCLRPDPSNEAQVFVGCRDVAQLWDTRRPADAGPVRCFQARCGDVLDLLPLRGGLELACSGDLVARDSCRAALSVWDVASGAPLSAQLYQERYTLPCLEELPPGNVFLAQSNGNYIAMFDVARPYRLNKKLRYEGHTVGGHAVRCSASPDGVLLCSGDAEGVAHVYKVRSGAVASVVAVPGGPAVTHPHWHPSRPGLLALGCADGSVHLCR
ncbi:hypothetical protein HPB47_026567 [Ixodes persulcatus]|uniref:Uncharacterized protein n=1 Tax=Ixodes persulcatus TaxID=34615 RepID=A0AC60PZV4_IXOPE|nr:hypothetical protein HPB47_026567 [Ixodes persulcatus]